MTLASPPPGLTAEDVLSLPNNGSMEFVNGRIVEKHVSELSADTEAQILFVLKRFTHDDGIAKVYPQSLGYQCFRMLPEDPDRMRKPDVTVIRMERQKALKIKDPGYMPISPDLAVEVISRNDLAYEITEKVSEYRAAGFPLVWVVAPIARAVIVHPNPGRPFVLSEDDTIDAPNALPGFSCKVADLFPSD
jgi:Uma2 family endonuclease